MIRIDGQTSTARRPKAYVTISDPETGTQEFDTLMCMHCQYHWRVIPGSGRKRGWCAPCNGPLCGKEQCLTSCKHFMTVIEEIEGRTPRESNLALLECH